MPRLSLSLKSFLVFASLALVLMLGACERAAKPQALSGETMGTGWSVKWHGSPTVNESELLEAIETRLIDINSSMSTWDPSSVISRFNRTASTDWVPIPEDMLAVLQIAQDVNQYSGGAFDITIAPLARAWGFGAEGRVENPPDPQKRAALAAAAGADLLALRPTPPALRKFDPATEVDLSGVAKGYAVDVLVELMLAQNIENFLVEIGGEVRARGKNSRGQFWRVGIEAPESDKRSIQQIIGLDDLAMASSGDYRNYFERDGVRYSHTIDPLTAAPVTHNLAAVTVIAQECAVADAWATALMALGPKRGYEIAEREGLVALFILREGEEFTVLETSALKTTVRLQELD